MTISKEQWEEVLANSKKAVEQLEVRLEIEQEVSRFVQGKLDEIE